MASDDKRADRAPDPGVRSTIIWVRILRIFGFLARCGRHDYQLVVKLLETLVEFDQEVLPLGALTLWFATQVEEQWQKVLCKQSTIGSIIRREQRRFQRAPRHVGNE
jgi:hypothetical protein